MLSAPKGAIFAAPRATRPKLPPNPPCHCPQPSLRWLTVHPIAFRLAGLDIYWYGILVATGFMAGLWTAARRARHGGVPPERIVDLGPWLIVGALVGARALYVFSYWREQFAGGPLLEIFKIRHGGLVFYGGLIGATATCLIFVRIHGLSLWKVADTLAPSIALGYAFGRIGCLMYGCCYGRECSLPWAIHFPPDHITHGAPVHPTEIYDSLLSFAFYIFLARLYRWKKFDGQVFAVYLVGYAILRSFVECFRGDYPVHYLGGWATPAQVVSIGIVAGGILLWFVLPRPQPKHT
jgi:phosphatidylglycerol:prolipoprotein diacylglycerol transferase